MAEVVLLQLIAAEPDLDGHVTVTSAGTANWHVGDEMDPRARRALERAGYTQPGSTALFASEVYLNNQDVVMVMTREHLATVRERLTNPDTDVLLWRQLIDPRGISMSPTRTTAMIESSMTASVCSSEAPIPSIERLRLARTDARRRVSVG